MKRYLNSFFITSSLYILSGIVFFYSISHIQISQKKEKSVTKISLSSVAISEVVEKVEEPIKEEKKEEQKEEIVEKIVETPTPKVIEKPKKVEKKIVKKEKEIKEVVEKVVEKPIENIEKTEQVAKEETTFKQESSTLSSSNVQKNQNLESEYLAKVQAKIEKNKIYPKAAKRLNQTGKVVVSFDILKDGKVTNIRIIHKSRFEKLDDASIELLTNIGFFEAIPNELNRTVWENIQIPINYQIN